MGLFKSIKKAVGKVFKFAGDITGTNYLQKKLKKPLQDIFGITAQKNMAASQEQQLKRQSEAAKLDSMNEVQNVTQFDDSSPDTFTGAGSRRKKGGADKFSSGIGLKM